MSDGEGEQTARSVALEQAYVHEVYEQCAEKTLQSRHWPRIYRFLEELEPGALVCDVGCGNGKYLSVNNNVFKVGADRCKRLTNIARDNKNEVLMCDNLALPFRDESFDAVLSIAVVHHFATTERRVNALKELARVLRIGGRLVISVWAMEQRHRKFESQDVLVPWPKAYCLNSRSNAVCSTGGGSGGSGGSRESSGGYAMPCIDELDSDRIAEKCLVTSSKSRRDHRKCKNTRSYWIDPIFSPSPSTSSLSSPNETCYSFFRRALQKLAGAGKRGSSTNRTWFLESWENGDTGDENHRRRRRRHQRHNDSDDIGDVDDIPIELRRLEDDNLTLTKLPDALSIKSKSLGDILEIQRLDLVRSRSSIPGFSSTLTSELYLDDVDQSKTPSPTPPPPPNTQLLTLSPSHNSSPSSLSSSAAALNFETTCASRIIPTTAEPFASLGSSAASTPPLMAMSSSCSLSGSKPRLVKQESHILEDSEFFEKSHSHADSDAHNTAIREIIKDLAEFPNVDESITRTTSRARRGNVHKQSSMNEELMSMERLMERDIVRKNIMKQASLNEEIICKPSRTFGHFRDTIYSASATKRFQLIKSGLTNRIKQSTTTSMEKVSSMAMNNGFVKILQSWTSTDNHDEDPTLDDHLRTHQLDQRTTSDPNNIIDKDLIIANNCPKSNKSGVVAGQQVTISTGGKSENELIERRLSKEDGSDSSKDSSLQSDTSVDSEDSFASVIYVPKQSQQSSLPHQQYQHHHHYHPHHHHHHHHPYHHSGSDENADTQQNFHQNSSQYHQFPSLIDMTSGLPVSAGTVGYQLRTTSAPPSPRIKHPPEIHGIRPSGLKLISMSPLVKQFPATSKSLPPPSPPGLSPRNFYPYPITTGPFFPPSIPADNKEKSELVEEAPTIECPSNDNIDNIRNNEVESKVETTNFPIPNLVDPQDENINDKEVKSEETSPVILSSSSIETVKSSKKVPVPLVVKTTVTIEHQESKEPTKIKRQTSTSVIGEDGEDNLSEKSSSDSVSEEDTTRRTRLIQIKELLRQKPGFATRCGKTSFPLVRRASTATAGRYDNTVHATTLPRLLSLELFNPETDDLDSDSSGLSSPESVGSVISVISDERFTILNKENAKKTPASSSAVVIKEVEKVKTEIVASEQTTIPEKNSQSQEPTTASSTNPRDLLKAAACVANSLQDAVGTAIRVTPASIKESTTVVHRQFVKLDSMPEDEEDNNTWNEECRRHLVDYTEKLEENLISDIERYCQSTKDLDDPQSPIKKQSISSDNNSRISPKIVPIIPEIFTDHLSSKAQNRNNNALGSSNCKYSQLVDDTIAWLSRSTGPDINNDHYYQHHVDDNNTENSMISEAILRGVGDCDDATDVDERQEDSSNDFADFVMVSKTGECIGTSNIPQDEESELAITLSAADDNSEENPTTKTTTRTIPSGAAGTRADNKTRAKSSLKHAGGDSLDSTELNDSIENSVSLLSDASQNESVNTRRLCSGSTTSLGSSNHEYRSLRDKRHKYLCQNRSASEETPTTSNNDQDEAIRLRRSARESCYISNSLKDVNLSCGSSSQESLISDHGAGGGGSGGGGSITYHQYYHVFREGELDQLINKYVENLHIISSYYDHASWCIVAEKVQVWTI